jgi:hypothetical protein
MTRLAFVLTVLAIAGLTGAQDRASLLDAVRQEVDAANAPRLSASERDATLARAIAARAELMRAHADDAHRPVWLLDQAADRLARLSVTLLDLRLVTGLLDPQERDRAMRMAEDAFIDAETAGALIEARFEAQRAVLEAGGELTDEDRELNRRLAETEQAVRRPLLMGRAMALQVGGGGELGEPQRVIELLDGLRVSPGAPRIIRDNALAMALARIEGGAGRPRAAALLDAVLALPPDPTAARLRAEATLLRARLAQGAQAKAAMVDEAASKPPFTSEEGLRDPALYVAAVEARARVLVEGGLAEAAARTIMGLVERRDLGGTEAQWSAVVDDRLAALAQFGGDWNAVAPDATLRTATALVSRDRPELDARAASMLANLLERIDAERERAAKAKGPWTEPPEALAAAELLARLDLAAAAHLEDEPAALTRRQRAVSLVLGLLEAQNANLDGLLSPAATLAIDPLAMGLDLPARRSLLEAALARQPGDPMAHRWRIALAAMLMELGDSWPRALELSETAMRSADAATRADATMLAGAAHAWLVANTEPAAPATLDILTRALEFARAHPSSIEIDPDDMGVRLARGLIERNHTGDAAAVLAALGTIPGQEATVLRARAYDVLGRREEAFEAYFAAAERLRSQGNDGDDFWRAWTRVLEMSNERRQEHLAAGRADAARTIESRLRGHLLRLKAEDPELGGPPWSTRLKVIEASFGR